MFRLFTLLLTLVVAVPATAQAYDRISDRTTFVNTVDGKDLKIALYRLTLNVNANGSINGALRVGTLLDHGHGKTDISAAIWIGLATRLNTTASWLNSARFVSGSPLLKARAMMLCCGFAKT